MESTILRRQALASICGVLLILAANMAHTSSRAKQTSHLNKCENDHKILSGGHEKSVNSLSNSPPGEGDALTEGQYVHTCKDTSMNSTTHSDIQRTTKEFQLVLYQPNVALPIFQEEQREFQIAGRTWRIVQQWNQIGLAAVVWEAGESLAEYLENIDPAVLKGKRAIELGAGTGLVGMVASSLGKTSSTMAHADKDSVDSIALTDRNTAPATTNLKLNVHNLENKNVTISELEWGVTDISEFDPPYDVILASDVIYKEAVFPLLIQTLKDLSSHDSLILLSCKRRYVRDDKFFELLNSSGEFSVEVLRVCGASNDIKIYRLQKEKYTTLYFTACTADPKNSNAM